MSACRLQEEPSRLDLQEEPERRGLMGLPPELLVMVLARVPLRDLAKLRQVCRRLRDMVDGPGGRRLWAAASLEGLAVDSTRLPLIERAAEFGNKEALIKLAMAFLYNQGVPKGAGAGTLESWNGIRAANLLLRLDSSSPHSRPLSWFLIRPPWSSSVSNKVCAYHKMVERCLDQNCSSLGGEGREIEANTGLFYSLGQTVNFLEADGKTAEAGQAAVDWFERGASHCCPFSSLEVWRRNMKPHLAVKEVPAVRSLRKIIAMDNHTSSLDAKMELCMAYAGGYTGSVRRDETFVFIRDLMAASQPSLSHSIFTVQKDITNAMRFITVDWMIEIAELKSLSSRTLHQAVALFDAYLLSRQVERSALQLLGVTAILVASRWSGATMLTIRESSWLTDNTYAYEEVVKMMAELLGAFRGDIQGLTISDYLEVLLTLIQASPTVHSMALYLSEAVLLHPDLSRFSLAHLAASCLLTAQILLRQDHPWPVLMEQATGFSLSSLSSCCLTVYQRCLTKEFSVADHRGVELCAVVSRYSHPSHHCISKQEVMSLEEFSEQLGVTFDPGPTTPRATPQKKDRVLSFLSDSCYLSSPLWFSGSDSESELESDLVEEGVAGGEVRGLAGRESGCLSTGSSSSSLTASAGWASPLPGGRSLEPPSLSSHTHNTTNKPSSSSSATIRDHRGLRHKLATSSDVGLNGLNEPTSIENLGHRGLSQKLPEHHHHHRLCVQSSNPLTRFHSLSRCDTTAHSSLAATGKTDRAHVSCPDFHSNSTDDMELGSVSQDEDPEDMETSSLETREPLFPGACPEFGLPPLVHPGSPGSRNSPITTPQDHPGETISPAEVPTGKSKAVGVTTSPAVGFENQANSLKLSKKKGPLTFRTPLQSLTNAPSVLTGRQQGSGKQEKPVIQAQPANPANFSKH